MRGVAIGGHIITDIYRNIDKNDKNIDKKYFYQFFL